MSNENGIYGLAARWHSGKESSPLFALATTHMVVDGVFDECCSNLHNTLLSLMKKIEYGSDEWGLLMEAFDLLRLIRWVGIDDFGMNDEEDI